MIDVSKVGEIVQRHGMKKEHMIAILLDCQEEYRYLPREVLDELAERIEMPLTSVLRIATFFRAFSLRPVGRHQIHVCMGTACNIQGGPRLLEALERELKVKRGDTTPDLEFSLDTVNCVGCCGLAPVVTVGQEVHGKLKISGIPRMIKKYRKEALDAKAVH
ncbi:MAG TPA: NAD(P)H-dependent oxidoreductase subunit E [Acidobacteriota bacterium]|nr:NAD(P)H-dependent oxidoreductase subunit E [Acidobacteriota bacterium]